MDLSIVVVNYRTPLLLLQCIDSIYKETSVTTFEIIVVDNHSEDESRELVAKEFSSVIWIQLSDNKGFAGANNEGIKHANGNYILLLNSDTIILENAIDKCLTFLKNQTDTSVKVLGCTLLNKDYSIQPSTFSHSSWPNLKEVFWQNIVTGKTLQLFKRETILPPLQNASSTHVVDSISGAYLLFDKKIIKDAGLLDPAFFMFYEEIEWERRITKRGYKIIYYAEAKIIHLERGSSAGIDFWRQNTFSRGLFILKVYGRSGYLFYLVMNYINISLLILLYPFLSTKSKAEFKLFVNRFLPFHPAHFWILFQYTKKLKMNQKPLKV